MIKIHYENGEITIATSKRNFIIKEINQIYLVQDKFKCYRDASETKQKCCLYTAILDALTTAKNQFIRDNEVKCLRKWL